MQWTLLRTDSSFPSITMEMWDMLQMPSLSLRNKSKNSHYHWARAVKSQGSYSQALGWAMTLQPGSSWILQALTSPFRFLLLCGSRLLVLCQGAPPSLSPFNLRATLKNLSPSGQMAGPGLSPKSSIGGHPWDKHGGRVGPESNSWCSIPPCQCWMSFGITSLAQEWKATKKRLYCYQTTACIE